MKVVFMGTPDFAVGTLEAILKAGHQVSLVVTQPDKPKGRGGQVQFPPVKECAMAHDIPVFQPVKIREQANVEIIKQEKPDIIIVAAFGQILPKEILDLPPYGCVNVHASLLPKYRGAAPIQWAVINGDEITGVTTMRMDVGLDTGDMIAKKEVRLDPEETGGSLFDRLAAVGADLCLETMKMMEEGRATYTPQNHDVATHTRMISKELGAIDFKKPAVEIERLIRGLNPWPSAYTRLDGKTFKIWKARLASPEEVNGLADKEGNLVPGRVVATTKDSIYVATGDGVLVLLEVQLEGKKRMTCDAFLRGYSIGEGTILCQ